MKKENLVRIFGTESPSIEKYRDWVLENNPETLQSWNPQLNSQERAVLSDDGLVKKPQGNNLFGPILIEEEAWNSYPNKYLPIEGAALIINCIRKVKKENNSSERFLLCINELEDLMRNSINESSNYCSLLHSQVMEVLRKHGIIVSETITILKKKFWENKNDFFNDFSKWTVGEGSIGKVDSPVTISKDWVTSIANEDEFESLKNAIIQAKIEVMKKNPQDWKIFKASKVSFPLPPYKGSSPSYVERKDGKEKIYKSVFNEQQWKNIEKALEKNNNVFLFLSRLVQ